MVRSLKMDKVRESFEYRNPGAEVVYLKIALDTSKREAERAEIRKVYELALELSGKTEDDVLKELDTPTVGQQQVRVYCMCGGGFLGRFAAEQPAHFYIDARVGGLSYRNRIIEKEVEKLREMMEAEGLDTKGGTVKMPDFHSCGVF